MNIETDAVIINQQQSLLKFESIGKWLVVHDLLDRPNNRSCENDDR